MKLRVGVLLIGSLWWDKNRIREAWRAKQFAKDDAISVKAPICYGRKSEKRRIYTMIISPSLPATCFGTALVKRCRNAIASSDDVFLEARELWKAESLGGETPAKGKPLFSAYWGCVALKPHPRFLHELGIEKQERELRRKLLQMWAATFRCEWEKRKALEERFGRRRREGAGPSAVYAASEKLKPAVDDEGLLQIDWPTLARDTAELDGFDLLLATATTPSASLSDGGYHDPTIVADTLKANPIEAVYFTSNQQHGITTFQDEQVKSLMKQR